MQIFCNIYFPNEKYIHGEAADKTFQIDYWRKKRCKMIKQNDFPLI